METVLYNRLILVSWFTLFLAITIYRAPKMHWKLTADSSPLIQITDFTALILDMVTLLLYLLTLFDIIYELERFRHIILLL